MPTGLFDVTTHEPVWHPTEVEAGTKQARENLKLIDDELARSQWTAQVDVKRERETAKWERAVATAERIDYWRSLASAHLI